MSDKLIIALPSKGRLKEQAEEIFMAAGYEVASPYGERNYRGIVVGHHDIEVAFLSASEIARELARGSIHLGVTGEDLIKENVARFTAVTCQVQPLGFGHADVVVAVPESWIDVSSMEDMDDVAAGFRARHGRRLRIATKYWNLTQQFFANHGIAFYRIVDSLGATEGAPAAGLADAIVDITSTGSTLKANYLKILDDGVILRSQANLFSSRTAQWNGASQPRAAALIRAISAALNKMSADEATLQAATDSEERFLDSLARSKE